MGSRAVLAAVEVALEEADLAALDAAGVALARRYARDIDEAHVLSVAAARWLREVEGWMDPQMYERVRAIFARIEETHVLATLGPKLVAVLVELGLTPRARASAGGSGKGADSGPPRNDLAAWRARRDQG